MMPILRRSPHSFFCPYEESRDAPHLTCEVGFQVVVVHHQDVRAQATISATMSRVMGSEVTKALLY